MVAGTVDHRAALAGSVDRSGWWLCVGSLHLYSFLNFGMENTKQTESLLVIVLGLIVLYWVKRWNGLLIAAFLIGILSLLVPAVARIIHWSWDKLAQLLGAVSGKVLLTLTYVLLLLPLALLARCMGKMTVKMKPGGRTYFEERDHVYGKEDLIHPW